MIPPFGCGAFDTDSAYVAPDIRGVALWLPPGQESDGEAMEAVVGDTIPEERLEEVGTVMAIMEEAHPTEAGFETATQLHGLQPLLPQPLDRGVLIATAFNERFLAVHHR